MLTYRDKGTSGTQLAIYSHELCIGHVAKDSMTGLSHQRESWRWTLGFHTAVPKGFPVHGYVDTLDQAKAIIERGWAEWLTAAGLVDRTA
jgi:hypothetical protein